VPWIEFPSFFFCADVLLHQFGDDLVLLDEFGPQPGDFFLLGGKPLGLAFGDRMEGGLCLIEQDFLPSVDLVGLGLMPYSSHRSDMGTLSTRYLLRMVAFWSLPKRHRGVVVGYSCRAIALV
jgi:hypothetical protein